MAIKAAYLRNFLTIFIESVLNTNKYKLFNGIYALFRKFVKNRILKKIDVKYRKNKS